VGIVDVEAINGRVRAPESRRDRGRFPEPAQPAARGQPFLIRMIDLNPPEEEWRLEDGRQLLEARNWDIRMLYSMAG
jgi:hypothetical protein